jgi:hypothetical protein
MKVLIAVITSHTRMDWSNMLRETWVPLVKNADVRFFLGRGAPRVTMNDEVILDCDDSYQGLPDKVKAVIKWAFDNSYIYMLKCDDDVVLKPKDLLASDFNKYDFSGHECAPKNQTPWGFNYWLSRKAMEIMRDQPLPQNNNDEAWVAHTMNRHGILLHSDPRYCLHYGRNLGIEPQRRALRRPEETSTDPSRYFSWCLHNHDVDKKIIFDEFKRIFMREVKTQ